MRIFFNKKLILICSSAVVLSLAGCGQSASSYFNAGTKAMKAGSYDEAAEAFKQAVDKNPDRAEYYISYGFALLEKGDTDGALIQFEKAYSDKKNQIVEENNKSALRGKGIASMKAGDYQTAIKALNQALDISENASLNDDIQKYLALAYTRAGDYEHAIQVYDLLVEAHPKEVDLYVARADIYAEIGDVEKAAADYDQALTLKPNEFQYYFSEYLLFHAHGMTEDADSVVKRALTIKTSNDMERYQLGILHFLNGDNVAAEDAFNTALIAGIDEANYYLGRLAAAQGKYEAAKSYYLKYEEAVGTVKMSAWYEGMAACLMSEEDYSGALEYIRKGLTMEDYSSRKAMLFQEVVCCEKLYDYSGALKAAEEYLKLYPDDEKMKEEAAFLSTRV